MSLGIMPACEPRFVGPSTAAIKSAAYPPLVHGEARSVYIGSRVYKLEEPIRRSWQFLQWLISAPLRLLDTCLPIMLPTSPIRKALCIVGNAHKDGRRPNDKKSLAVANAPFDLVLDAAVALLSLASSCWSVWTLVFVLFVAFDVPLRIAFQSWKHMPFLRTVSLLTSASFCLDAIVHFRTAYITDQGDMIRSPRRVAERYLFGMFSFDVLSALPLTDVLTGSSFQRIAPWLGLPRLFTLVRHLNDLMRTKYANLVSVARLLVAMLLVTHWAACLWNFMAMEKSGWPSMISEECRNCPDNQKYLLAFYRSFLMLLGDRSDTFNNLERIFAVVLLSLGACLYAVVVSSITMLVSNMWSMASRHKQRAAMLQDALRYRGADDDVRVRVDDYYDFMATFDHPGPDGVSILSELPSTLHAEALSSIFERMLVKVQLFAFCERPFIWRLAQRLRMSLFMAGDTIYNVGSVGHDMFLIWKGAVGLLEQDGSMAALLCDKDHFGELSLMVAGTPRPHRAVALRQCDIMLLSRWDLQDAVRDFPDSAKLVKQRACIGLEDHEATPAVWAATLAAKQARQQEELYPSGESRRLLGSAAIERWQADTLANASSSSSDECGDDARFSGSSFVSHGSSSPALDKPEAVRGDPAERDNQWGLRQRRRGQQPVGEATEQDTGELHRPAQQSSKPLPRSVLRQQSQDQDTSTSPRTRGQKSHAAEGQPTRTPIHQSILSSSPMVRNNDQQQVQLSTLQWRRPQDTSRRGGRQDTSRNGGLQDTSQHGGPQDTSRRGVAWDVSTSGRRAMAANSDATAQPEIEKCVPLSTSETSTHRGHLGVVTSVSSPKCNGTGAAGGKRKDSSGADGVRSVLRSFSGDNLLDNLAQRESSAPSLLILQPQPFLGLDPLGPLYDEAAKATATNGPVSQRRSRFGNSPTWRRKSVRCMSASYVGEHPQKRLSDIATLYGRLAYGRLEGMQGPCYNPGCALVEQELRDTRAELQEAQAELEHARAELGDARAQIETMQRKPLQIPILAAAFRSELKRVTAQLDAQVALMLKQLLEQLHGVGDCRGPSSPNGSGR